MLYELYECYISLQTTDLQLSIYLIFWTKMCECCPGVDADVDVDEQAAGEQEVDVQDVDEQQVGVSVGEHEQEVDELDVDEQDVGEQEVDEQDVDEQEVGEQDVCEQDVGEQEVDEHLDAVLATEGRLHDAAVPVGAGARIGQVCNETEYNTMQ